MFIRLIIFFFLVPIVSSAQYNCIDSTSIDPNCLCPFEYNPVCGCDGELYSNSCEASQCFGVTSYVSAYDESGNIIDCSTLSQANICDSISIELGSFSFSDVQEVPMLTINMTTFFTSSVTFDYAGFVLLDSEGEMVAEENIDYAANVYGFGSNYSDTRTLFFDDIVNLPFEGTLILYDGFFAGNPELACSFPISFSLDGSGVSLEGQYFLDEEYDYIKIDGDFLFIYDFEEDMKCYEFIFLEYLANDSVILMSDFDEGEQLMLNYEYSGDDIYLLNQEDSLLLISTSFDPSEWVECVDSLDCSIFNLYAETGECDSSAMVMVDVEFDVENQASMGFVISVNGTDYGSFEYGETFYTIGPIFADGETIYELAIIDNDDLDCKGFTSIGPIYCEGITTIKNIDKPSTELLFIKNLLGEIVTKVNKNRPYIYYYKDGSFEKRIIFTD